MKAEKKQYYLELILLLFIITLCQFFPYLAYNEHDVIPYSIAVYDENWLPNDWYLGLKIEYRYLFSYVNGFFAKHLGVESTVFSLRVLSYALFAIAYNNLRKTLQIKFWIGALSLLFFLASYNQTFGAKEWLIGGLETKVFAYICILFSLNGLLRRQWYSFFIFSGLALSFHLLIGAYYLLPVSIIVVRLLLKKEETLKSMLIPVILFCTLGMPGIIGIVKYLLEFLTPSTNVTVDGWSIYVNYRVPHHALPEWPTRTYVSLAIYTILNVLFFYKSSIKAIKTLSTINLTFVLLSIVGIVLYYADKNSLLRFYWFRMADSLLPLLSLPIAINWLYIGLIEQKRKLRILFIPIISLFVLSGFIVKKKTLIKEQLMVFTEKGRAQLKEDNRIDPLLCKWIKENTPSDAVFVIPPWIDSFYLDVGRATFATMKHSPQKNTDIAEWFKRMQLLNNNKPFTGTPRFFGNELQKNYPNTQLETFSNQLNQKVDYIVLPIRNKVNEEPIFITSEYAVYKIPS